MLSGEIQRLLSVGAIKECPSRAGQFISGIFLIPKSDGSHRLILNLKNLNKFIRTEHFKMENHKVAINLISEQAYLASLDLKDAYFLVPIANRHRRYLRFRFLGKTYEYKCLPFGLSTAPFVFTKLMKPLLSHLRGRGFISVLYIDDFLLIGQTYEDCLENIRETRRLLQEVGFVVNEKKSVLVPCQEIKYLGFIFNSVWMSMSLPREKQRNILASIRGVENKTNQTIQEFAKLVGKLIAACPAVKYGWAYTKSCERAKFLALERSGGSYKGEFTLSAEVREELSWWKAHTFGKTSLRPRNFTLEIFSDSSRSGWGLACGNSTAHGFWSEAEKACHINFLELLAAFFGLKCFARDRSSCDILLRIDNTTAISYINRMGSVQFPHLNSLTKQMWQWCEQRDLFIFASYIESNRNIDADRESRRLDDETEFGLADGAFQKICSHLRTPGFDLFATRNNAKCERFASWFRDPEAEIVDAFTISWADINFYAFPPFSLITRVLRKIISDRAEGVVVAPFWPGQPWYPIFRSLIIKGPLIFSPNPKLLLSVDRKPHLLHQKLSLAAGLLSGRR